MSVIDAISSRLGDYRHAANNEYIFCCPFCVERIGDPDEKGHMYVNPDTGYFCHRCTAGGGIQWLLKCLKIKPDELEGATLSAHDVREYLYLVNHSDGKRAPAIRTRVILPESTYPVWDIPDVMEYATKRGLTQHYCDSHGIYAWLDPQMSWRLLFTDYYEGALVFWQGRGVKNQFPKYLSAYGADKNQCIWNIEKINPDYPVYVAEGILSAIACGSNGVSIYGKHLSEKQLFMLKKHSGSFGIRVVLDGDARKDTLRILHKASRLGLPVGVVDIPKGYDPDSLPQAELEAKLLSSKAIPPEAVEMECLSYAIN